MHYKPCWKTWIVNTVCEREETAFILVSCVDRSFRPDCTSASTSSRDVTVTIDRSLTNTRP